MKVFSMENKNIRIKSIWSTTLIILFLFLNTLSCEKLYAQLIVTETSALNGWTADSLVRNILLDDYGIIISNAKFNGSTGIIECNNIGIFETGSEDTGLGIASGLILASGGVDVAIGPNNDNGAMVPTRCGDFFDDDLASIASGPTNDVAVLEFDFIPLDNMVTFNYVFGSEEYMEFVGSQYNDVFGFFIEGINPTGGYYDHQNIALIPGTTEVVSINTVNNHHSSRYYIDNQPDSITNQPPFNYIQFDGFTALMGVSLPVVPMSNYHIKMAICDVSDHSLDSGVFLEAHSFSTNFSYDMMIDDWSYLEIPENHYFCTNQGIEFNTVTTWNYDNVTWYFGDGTSAQGEQVTHAYNDEGIYTVTNVLHNPHRETDSLFLTTEIEVRGLVSKEYVTACNSFDWFGTNYTESGTYTYSIQTPDACDSTFILILTIDHDVQSDTTAFVCEEFIWYGQTYTETGRYEHMLHTVAGCDSLIVLELEIGENYSSEETATACNSFYWHGNTYTEDGIYTVQVQNSAGCDSTFVLNLTLGHDTQSDTTALVCEEFIWYGQTYTETGQYEHMLHTALGCDSLVILNLNVGDISNVEENITACNSYWWRGNTYSQGGTYTDIGYNSAGCDTIFTLNLTLGHDAVGDTTAINCEPIIWYGTTYSETGEYTHLLQTPLGCDSLLTLHLMIGKEQIHPVENEKTCEDSFTWHGNSYTQSGVYYDTIAGIAGCNDIYVLDLTISQGYNTSFNETICDRYPWPSASGGYLTESGYYQYEGLSQDGCDSIVDLNLTVNYTPGLKIDGLSQVAMTTDFGPFYTYYALDTIGVDFCSVIWSCSNPEWVIVPVDDSYKCMIAPTTLGQATLTAVTHCTTGCDAVCTFEINSTYYDVEEKEEDGVLLFPNPTNSQFTIQAHQLTHIRMFDSYGQILKDIHTKIAETVTINVNDLSQGVYFAEITTERGRTIKHLIILR